MPALSFKTRFSPMVEDGSKTHSIRGYSKVKFEVGKPLYLYEGMRTKNCRWLKTSVITRVVPVEISHDSVILDGEKLGKDELNAFAVSDGFKDTADFFSFWRQEYKLDEGLTLKMRLIAWEK